MQTEDVSTGFSIGSVTLQVEKGDTPRKRGRPAGSSTKVAATAPAAREHEAPVMVRVTPAHGYDIYAHTQKKLIYAGHETPIVRDKWVSNQIRMGILKVVG